RRDRVPVPGGRGPERPKMRRRCGRAAPALARGCEALAGLPHAAAEGARPEMIEQGNIRRILLGHFTMPADSSLPGQQVVVGAYLIGHPDGTVLFDTGVGRHDEAE